MKNAIYNSQKKYLRVAGLLLFVLATFITKAQNSKTTLKSISDDNSSTPHQKDLRKEEWIKNNKEEYVRMGGKVKVSEPEKTNSNLQTAKIIEPTKTQLKDDYGPIASPLSDKSLSKMNNNPYVEIITADEKNEWIKNNKAIYDIGTSKSSKIQVSKAEFNALPSDKQNAMRNDPNYIIN